MLGDKTPSVQSSSKIERPMSDMKIDYMVVVDQPDIEGMTKEEEHLGIGYSFGSTGFNNDN